MFLPRPPIEKEFENAPSGAHVGRCYKFIDLGTQPKTYNNVTTLKHMVSIHWELPLELMKDGRPFSVWESYNWSMHPKSGLREMLENWRGVKFTEADFGEGGFDTKKLIGATCTISVVQNSGKDGKMYSNVASVSRAMKGIEVPPMVNSPLYFSFEDFDGEVLNKLSNKMRDAIMRTPEYAKITGGNHVEDEENREPAPIPELDDTSIPF
jgi:hypothetical protein